MNGVSLSANNNFTGTNTFSANVQAGNGFGFLFGGSSAKIIGASSSNYIELYTNSIRRLAINGSNIISYTKQSYSTNQTMTVGDSLTIPTKKYVDSSITYKQYISKATSYTPSLLDKTIEVTATGLTITLPTAVGIVGKEYIIKLTTSGSATVATTSSQTMYCSTTYSLTAQYKYVFVQSNGSNWIIIGNN